MIALLALTLPAALAAYGVPGDDPYQDGFPSAEERELHLWTNAVRVDPEAFIGEYPCDFDAFQPSEQTPKGILWLDMGLAEAARYHSLDMEATGNFSHSSSDGTSFGERLSWFYDSGYAGENIAWNYGSPYATVFTGWMCSDGHRANIMLGDYNELGTGIAGAYMTQDFGAGTLDTDSPVAMGAHTPVDAARDADFMADWQDDAAPKTLAVVVDGIRHDLALTWGVETQGVYTASVELEAVDCHVYFFTFAREDGRSGTFPEEGSYTLGGGCTDEIGWVPEQADASGGLGTPGGGDGGGGDSPFGEADGGDDPDLGDPRLIGCMAVPAPAGALLGLLSLGALVGRRRRSA
ncbi:MAG: CAP domain-containing protein [Alphaproteobacteria bacterium]|nr:CAP domain-containing protein [Alphaproteobacteria bacterium]